jgi:hypothetical protein
MLLSSRKIYAFVYRLAMEALVLLFLIVHALHGQAMAAAGAAGQPTQTNGHTIAFVSK